MLRTMPDLRTLAATANREHHLAIQADNLYKEVHQEAKAAAQEAKRLKMRLSELETMLGR